MKKLGKFIFGTVTLATVAAGAYYLYKNFIKKDSNEDFDDFEDDFEDFDTEDDDSESREYVSLNIAPEDADASEEVSEQDATSEE